LMVWIISISLVSFLILLIFSSFYYFYYELLRISVLILLGKPILEARFEHPTVIRTEFGNIIYVWPTVVGRNIKVGLKGSTHVRLTVSVDAISYVVSCNWTFFLYLSFYVILVCFSSWICIHLPFSQSVKSTLMAENCRSASSLVCSEILSSETPGAMMYVKHFPLYSFYAFI
jgi:hypothetical protein